MEIEETIKAKGNFYFEAYDAFGHRRPEFDHEYRNVIVQNFFTAIFRFMNQSVSSPDVDDLNLTHFATGTGTATPMKSDIALGAEFFRKQITVKSFGLTSFVCKTVLAPTESNTTIREIGIFAKATAIPGSGTLISHCPVNIQKTANIQYIVTYTMTLQ